LAGSLREFSITAVPDHLDRVGANYTMSSNQATLAGPFDLSLVLF